jgi:predicted GNAT superfamily acetyltransferase
VEWNIAEETSKQWGEPATSHEVPCLIQVEEDAQGFPVPKAIFLDSEKDANILYVPVPNQFQTIKSNDLKIALNWRLKTREVFTYYLSKGWMVTALRKSDHPYLHHYVLEKKLT